MSMGLFCVAKIFVEGFHWEGSLSTASFQLNIGGVGGLFPPPANAIFCDFHDDAGVGEFCAQRI
jgi:hypothetical protein